MCRSFYFVYEQTEKYPDMEIYKFNLPNNLFNQSNPINDGFCLGSDCLGDGVQNISKCYGGNIFVRWPFHVNSSLEYVDDELTLF